jgi:hypothetical protein
MKALAQPSELWTSWMREGGGAVWLVQPTSSLRKGGGAVQLVRPTFCLCEGREAVRRRTCWLEGEVNLPYTSRAYFFASSECLLTMADL